MLDEDKTKNQLITELRDLHQRLHIFEREQQLLKRGIIERKRAENIMQARLRLLKFAESHSLEEFTQATLDESEGLTAALLAFSTWLSPISGPFRFKAGRPIPSDTCVRRMGKISIMMLQKPASGWTVCINGGPLFIIAMIRFPTAKECQLVTRR